MLAKGSKLWLFLLVPVVVGLLWLYFSSGPKMTVMKNERNQTVQQILENDKVFVSYKDELRYDGHFQDRFLYVIILDRFSFNQYEYLKDRPMDAVWITGDKQEETRVYIFTNHTPPSAINELTMYLYR